MPRRSGSRLGSPDHTRCRSSPVESRASPWEATSAAYVPAQTAHGAKVADSTQRVVLGPPPGCAGSERAVEIDAEVGGVPVSSLASRAHHHFLLRHLEPVDLPRVALVAGRLEHGGRCPAVGDAQRQFLAVQRADLRFPALVGRTREHSGVLPCREHDLAVPVHLANRRGERRAGLVIVPVDRAADGRVVPVVALDDTVDPRIHAKPQSRMWVEIVSCHTITGRERAFPASLALTTLPFARYRSTPAASASAASRCDPPAARTTARSTMASPCELR